MWDIGKGLSVRSLKGHKRTVHCIAVNSDLVASGNEDTIVEIRNASNGQLMHLLKDHDEEIYALALNVEEDTLATGSKKHHVPRMGHNERVYDFFN